MNPHHEQPAPRRSRWRLIAVGLLIAAGGVTGAILWRDWLPRRFAVVEPGVLYRSAQPKVDQLRRVVEREGIRTIAIVRAGDSDRVLAEKEFAAEHGLRIVHIPIESRARLTDDWIDTFFATVDDPANRPVLVHCSAGRHRTGLLCALYRMRRQNWSAADARREMLSFGFDVEPHRALLEQFDELARKDESQRASAQGSAAPP